MEPEEPAVAPAYEPAYEPAKEEPAVAPAYEPSYQPAVAPSYEPSNLPTYKTIYYNADPVLEYLQNLNWNIHSNLVQSPPVYEPQTYEPAAVDTVDNLSVAGISQKLK